MEKIKLTKNAKRLFLLIGKHELPNKPLPENDIMDVCLLKEEGFITFTNTSHGPANVDITERGIAYIRINPKLKNPTIWDDKKYLINTTISILALLISSAAFYFAYIKS